MGVMLCKNGMYKRSPGFAIISFVNIPPSRPKVCLIPTSEVLTHVKKLRLAADASGINNLLRSALDIIVFNVGTILY